MPSNALPKSKITHPPTRMVTRSVSRAMANTEPQPQAGQATVNPTVSSLVTERAAAPRKSPKASKASNQTRKPGKRPRGDDQASKPAKVMKMTQTDSEREKQDAAKRLAKEKRELKKRKHAEQVKEKMAQLDAIEASIKDGTHPAFVQAMKDKENKLQQQIKVIESRRRLETEQAQHVFDAAKKAANDDYQFKVRSFRQQMAQEILTKYNQVTREYQEYQAYRDSHCR